MGHFPYAALACIPDDQAACSPPLHYSWDGLDGHNMRVPLVRGAPYITFEFFALTPNLTTDRVIEEPKGRVVSDRITIRFNNDETWVLYASEQIDFLVSWGQPTWLEKPTDVAWQLCSALCQ